VSVEIFAAELDLAAHEFIGTIYVQPLPVASLQPDSEQGVGRLWCWKVGARGIPGRDYPPSASGGRHSNRL